MLISYKPHQNIEGLTLLERFLTVLHQYQLFKASVISSYYTTTSQSELYWTCHIIIVG